MYRVIYAIERPNSSIRDIATLGPDGTDSSAAAEEIMEKRGIPGKVTLYDTFADALESAIMNGSYFLIPAAYAQRDKEGRITESFGDFNFRNMDRFIAADAFVLNLKEMCLAKRCDKPQSISLHPATEVFADKYAPGLRREYTASKPAAVDMCSTGVTDRCIGSVDVVATHANLKIIERWQPQMVWVLYTRR